MLAGVGGKGLDLLFALLYLRVLRPEGVAALQYLVIFTTYLDTVVNFGFNTLLARDVSRAPGQAWQAFRTVSLVRLGLWLLGAPVVWLVVGPLRAISGLPEEAALAGWLFYLALLPSIPASSASGLLWAAERLELPALVSLVTTVLKIVASGALLLLGWGLVGMAVAAVAVNVVTAVVLLALARGATAPVQPPAGDALAVTQPRALLRESWPLFVNQLLAGLFFKVDGLLLPGLAGERAAGSYAAAYKVVDGVGVISSSFTLALFPRLARQAVDQREALSRAYRLSLRVLVQVSVPLAAGISLLAEPIVALLGGRDYLPEGALALTLLIWFLPLSFCNGLTQYVLIAVGRQRFLTPVFLGAFAFNLAANVVLVPRYGLVGAALVTVLSELVLLVPFRWAASQSAPGASFLRELWHPAIATLLMAPVVWWVRDSVHPLAAMLVGAAIYPLALVALGGVDEEQRTALEPMMPARLRSLLRASSAAL